MGMSDEQTALAVFEKHPIRRFYDESGEMWYFSVVDAVAALTDSVNARDYWFKMKIRVKTEDGFELSTICRQLKLRAPDGKMRETDCANVEGLFRIIQSIPSPKAEPFKQWLAKVGYERIQDMSDPARSLDRARDYWRQHGRSEKWIQQRMMGQETRNKLTDYWKDHAIKGEDEYAILTNIILEIEKGKKAGVLLARPSRTSRRYLQIEDLRPDAKPKFVEPFACPLATATDVIIAWDGANAGTVSCNLDGCIGSTLAILRPSHRSSDSPPWCAGTSGCGRHSASPCARPSSDAHTPGGMGATRSASTHATFIRP
jgi:hypothetical protein